MVYKLPSPNRALVMAILFQGSLWLVLRHPNKRQRNDRWENPVKGQHVPLVIPTGSIYRGRK